MRRCPGCKAPFWTALGLDAHRRHLSAYEGCRYQPGERRTFYRPSRTPASQWRT